MDKFLLYTNDSFRFPTLPIALDGIGLSHLQEPILRVQGIPTHQWVQCIKGRGRLNIDNKSYIIEEGSGIFLPANYPHEYRAIDGEWYVNFLCFNGLGILEWLKGLGLENPGVYSLALPEIVLQYEQQIAQLYEANEENKVLKASKILYALIIDLTLDISQNTSSQSSLSNNHLNRATTYMESHFHRPVSLEEIAQSVNISKEYLCALFKKHLGISIFDLLLSIRIAHAKTYLIEYPQKKIYEIANMVSYEDCSYFCSVFKKKEGMSPLAFRNTRR